MTQEEFVQQLRSGVVRFSFTKKGGDTRQAKGTLKMDLIPVSDHPKSQGAAGVGMAPTANVSTQTYYDLEKNGWRSFNWDNFRGVL